MAFGHITSWHKDREKVEAVKDFIFYGSKTTVDGAMKLNYACSLEEELWANLDSILKSGDITLPTKVHLVKTMVFPVVICECGSWTIKKAEH